MTMMQSLGVGAVGSSEQAAVGVVEMDGVEAAVGDVGVVGRAVIDGAGGGFAFVEEAGGGGVVAVGFGGVVGVSHYLFEVMADD
jgi:hypothetical protein